MDRLIATLAVLGLTACAAPQQPTDIGPGFFVEGGVVRGSYAPDQLSREALHADLKVQCPRLRSYRELISYTPGLIGFEARCR